MSRFGKYFDAPWIHWYDEGPIPVTANSYVEYKTRARVVCGPQRGAHTLPGWNWHGTRAGKPGADEIIAYRILVPFSLFGTNLTDEPPKGTTA